MLLSFYDALWMLGAHQNSDSLPLHAILDILVEDRPVVPLVNSPNVLVNI